MNIELRRLDYRFPDDHPEQDFWLQGVLLREPDGTHMVARGVLWTLADGTEYIVGDGHVLARGITDWMVNWLLKKNMAFFPPAPETLEQMYARLFK